MWINLLCGISLFTASIALTVEPLSSSESNPAVFSAVAPIYPPIALAAKASGEVIVAVEIDREGNVISAKADGHPLLQKVSEATARRWRFASAIAETKMREARIIFVFRIPEKDLPDELLAPVFKPPYKVEVTRNLLRVH